MLFHFQSHTFKVGHVGPDIGVQGVDDHLAVRWAGDLNTAVDETRSWRGTLPGIVLTDVLGLGQEVEKVSSVNLSLALDAALEQSLAGGVEGAVQQSQEGHGLLAEDLAGFVAHVAQDGNILQLSLDGSHDERLISVFWCSCVEYMFPYFEEIRILVIDNGVYSLSLRIPIQRDFQQI